jgi:CHAT domain-containing protein
MKRFYAHLLAHSSAGSALTGAKRDMLQTFGREALPYQWAGFTIEGAGTISSRWSDN